MKTKIVLSILLMTGIVMFGCASASQINPSLEGVSFDGYSTFEYQSQNQNQPIQYNRDGSITLLRIGNIQFRIMPMTSSRSSRGALDRSPAEFNTLIRQLEANIAANPQDYDSYIMLAGLLIDRGGPGDAENAVKYSDLALSIRHNDPDALYARGIAYSEYGDAVNRNKAIKDLEVVLQSNLQSMKGAYYVMGMVYYKDGKIPEAISAFEKVKAIDPNFVDTNEILSVLYNR